jgi:hypothetical protein
MKMGMVRGNASFHLRRGILAAWFHTRSPFPALAFAIAAGNQVCQYHPEEVVKSRTAIPTPCRRFRYFIFHASGRLRAALTNVVSAIIPIWIFEPSVEGCCEPGNNDCAPGASDLATGVTDMSVVITGANSAVGQAIFRCRPKQEASSAALVAAVRSGHAA